MAKFKSVSKSRKNTSGRKSKAVKEAEAASLRLSSGKTTVMTSKRPGRERLARGVPYKIKPLTAMEVRQLPSTPASIRGMTLRQLIRSTPRLFINNAVDVEAAKVEMKRTRTARPVIAGRMVTYDPWRNGRIRRVHETYIVGMGEDDKQVVNRHKKVLVQCSCESFVFTFEYANATVGASRMIYCNGQPPNFTNPAFIPGMCKHLIALAKIAMEQDL